MIAADELIVLDVSESALRKGIRGIASSLLNLLLPRCDTIITIARICSTYA